MSSEVLPCDECWQDAAQYECARCKSVFYCSKECQRVHWPRHSKKCHIAGEASISEDQATYEINFTAEWSARTHPTVDFPRSDVPHFSSLVGAVHGDDVSLWREGALASRGIKDMAELGETRTLIGEIRALQDDGKHLAVIKGFGVRPSPGETGVRVRVSRAIPLVTLVTMIVPSPDWFVGVDSLSLWDGERQQWKKEVLVDLFPYDAGTDAGTTFDAADEVQRPFLAISPIIDAPNLFVPNKQLGTFRFTRVPSNQ